MVGYVVDVVPVKILKQIAVSAVPEHFFWQKSADEQVCRSGEHPACEQVVTATVSYSRMHNPYVVSFFNPVEEFGYILRREAGVGIENKMKIGSAFNCMPHTLIVGRAIADIAGRYIFDLAE